MKKKKSLFMAIALLILSIVIIAGSTYAYFIATINNDNAADVDIQARTLGLHFEDGAEINLPDALPGVTVIKKFSVTNTGTESTTYNIYINDLVNEFTNTDEVVYELSSTNGGATITERAFPTASGAIASNIEIPTDTTQEYTMTIRYLNTNSSQNIDMGKKISGLIQIEEKTETTNKVSMIVYTPEDYIDGDRQLSEIFDFYHNDFENSELSKNVQKVKRNGEDVTTEYFENSGAIYLKPNDEVEVLFDKYLTSTNHMFSDNSQLGIGFSKIDLSSLDTSHVTDMGDMFSGWMMDEVVEEIIFGPNFDTSHVINMTRMFYGCTNLTNIDISMFDTSNVTDMSYMFQNCINLTTLDLSSFNTSNVTNMDTMFSGMENLKNLNIANFDTIHNPSISQYLFYMTKPNKIIYNSTINNWHSANTWSSTGFVSDASWCDVSTTNCDNFFD